MNRSTRVVIVSVVAAAYVWLAYWLYPLWVALYWIFFLRMCDAFCGDTSLERLPIYIAIALFGVGLLFGLRWIGRAKVSN